MGPVGLQPFVLCHQEPGCVASNHQGLSPALVVPPLQKAVQCVGIDLKSAEGQGLVLQEECSPFRWEGQDIPAAGATVNATLADCPWSALSVHGCPESISTCARPVPVSRPGPRGCFPLKVRQARRLRNCFPHGFARAEGPGEGLRAEGAEGPVTRRAGAPELTPAYPGHLKTSSPLDQDTGTGPLRVTAEPGLYWLILLGFPFQTDGRDPPSAGPCPALCYVLGDLVFQEQGTQVHKASGWINGHLLWGHPWHPGQLPCDFRPSCCGQPWDS